MQRLSADSNMHQRFWRWLFGTALVLGLLPLGVQGAPLAEPLLRLMSPTAHMGSVDALAVRPDAELVATGGSDQRIHLWHLPSARQWRTLAGHRAGVRTLAFSPDGSLLASGDEFGEIRVWRVGDGANLCSWKNVDDRDAQVPANQASMRVGWDDGDRIWSVGQRGLARQWRVTGCAETERVALHDGVTWDVLKERNGWIIATQNAVVRLDAHGKNLWHLPLETAPTSLHRRGQNSAVLLSDGRVLEFDTKGHTAKTPPIQIDNSSGTSLAPLGDGWIATSGSRVLTHYLSGKSQEITPLDAQASDASHSLLTLSQVAVYRQKIIAAGAEGLVVLDEHSFLPSARIDVSHQGHHNLIASSAASGRMFVGGISQGVLWDVSAGRALGTLTLPDPQATILDARFSVDGRSLYILASGLDERSRRIDMLLRFSLDNGQFLPAVKLPGGAFELVLDSVGGRIFVATNVGVFAYRSDDFSLIGQFGSLRYAEHVDVDENGKRLLAANSNEAELMDLADGHLQKRWEAGDATYEALGGAISDARIGLQGETVLFATSSGVVTFDAGGTRRWRKELPEDYRRRLALAPNGRMVLAGGATATRLDAQTGEVSALTLPVATESLGWLDSRNILMLGADDAVRLWQSDARSLLELRTFERTQPSACGIQAGLCNDPPPWIVASEDGRFDLADFRAFPQLVWYDRRDSYRPLQLEWFARKAFFPRLLSRTLTWGLPSAPALTGGPVSPSVVRIVNIEPMPGHPRQLRVEIEVESGSAALGGIQLYRDGVRVARLPATTLVRSGKIYKGWIEQVRVPDYLYEPIHFEAIAFDVEGISSNASGRDYKVPFDAAATWTPPRTWLLNIGVNRHENPSFDLDFAVNDARRLGDTLMPLLAHQRHGSEQVIRVPLIADTDPAEASKARIREALMILSGTAPKSTDPKLAVLDRVQPSDTVLISFSGHGAVGGDGEFYLLPGDTGSGDGRKVTPDLLARSISSHELAQWLDPLDAGRVILVLDACHAAAAVNANGFVPGPMDSAGLGQLAYDKGFAVLGATQASDVALESARLKQGVLTYALTTDGLEAAAADFAPRDGRIDYIEWLRYGVTRVPDLARQIRHGNMLPAADSRSAMRVGQESVPAAVQTPTLFYFSRGRRDGPLFSVPH